MNRSELLRVADDMVSQERATTYGDANRNFNAIAELWSAYLGIEINAVDVSMLMALLKIGRVNTAARNPAAGPAHVDSFIDIAGYAALGGEIYTEGFTIGAAENKPGFYCDIKEG